MGKGEGTRGQCPLSQLPGRRRGPTHGREAGGVPVVPLFVAEASRDSAHNAWMMKSDHFSDR